MNPAAVEAEALVSRGVELRQRGSDEEALRLFRQAFQLSHTPRAQAQIGLAEQALGNWVEAEREMQAALLDQADPWIGRNRAALENALRVIQSHLATLQVVSNGPNATLWLNGVQVGPLPLPGPLRYEIGTVAIEVRAPGYITARRVIELSQGISQRETLNLVPRDEPTDDGAQAGPGTSHTPANGASTSTRSASRSGAGPADTGTAGSSSMNTAGTVLLAAGGVFAIGGIAGHAYWQSRVALYNTNDQCFYGEMSRMERCGGVLANADTGLALTIVGYAGAGVLLAAGAIVKYLAAGSGPASSASAAVPDRLRAAPMSRATQMLRSLACGPGPAALGASCGAAF